MIDNMKGKIIFLCLNLFFIILTVTAQDVIITKNSQRIDGKVTEISIREIKYIPQNHPDGLVIAIPISNVSSILFSNGEVKSFNIENSNTEAPITEGMSYNEYKNLYSSGLYVPQHTDPYSRVWAGIGSAIIPGLGQGISGEWGRGLAIFAGHFSLSLGMLSQITPSGNGGSLYNRYDFTSLYWTLATIQLFYDIWAICDAVHVAKIKNMYYQDIQSMRSLQSSQNVQCKCYPCFTYNIMGNSSAKPILGVSLSLNF